MCAHIFLYKGFVRSQMIKNIYYILYEKKDKIDKGGFYFMNVIQIKTVIAIHHFVLKKTALEIPLTYFRKIKTKSETQKHSLTLVQLKYARKKCTSVCVFICLTLIIHKSIQNKVSLNTESRISTTRKPKI
jgi:hypothetical protein